MKPITDNVYAIEGLLIGHAYVIEGTDGITVIDTSVPNSLGRIEKELQQIRRSLHDVSRILITHAHFDHIGSLAALQKATGALVYAHPNDAPVIVGESPQVRPSSQALGLFGKAMSMLPASKLEASKVDCEVRDGDVLNEVAPGLTVIATHGHSPGHVSYYLPSKKLMFTGDVVFHFTGMGLPLGAFTVDMAENKRSIHKIAAMDIDVLCFGHGRPIIGGASSALRRFAEKLKA